MTRRRAQKVLPKGLEEKMKHNELHLLPTSPATLANSKGPSYRFDAEEEEEVPSSTYVPWPFRYPCSTEIGSPGTTRVELDITSRTMVYNCDHFNLLLHPPLPCLHHNHIKCFIRSYKNPTKIVTAAESREHVMYIVSIKKNFD